jgi:hypothetical protein
MPQPDQIESSAEVPSCPKCGGAMWDNREGKRNPKAPDFKCKDRSCDGVIWPPRGSTPAAGSGTPQPSAHRAAGGSDTPPPGATASPAPSRATSPRPAVTGPRVDSAGMPLCPVCGGPMWDDRTSKRNPRAPDFKCRNKPRERGGPGCEGVIWPARDGSPSPYPPSAPRRSAPPQMPAADDGPRDGPPVWDAPPLDDDDLPF